jgi:hypothetical protein
MCVYNKNILYYIIYYAILYYILYYIVLYCASRNHVCLNQMQTVDKQKHNILGGNSPLPPHLPSIYSLSLSFQFTPITGVWRHKPVGEFRVILTQNGLVVFFVWM